ncbi:MAG: hypothetical protein J3K34DRAFT_229514 [Monoraphidium minutum]|nr:MAG: hypothetical protein J3K34DRAFT_229514 [Monoraphidium minutum]
MAPAPAPAPRAAATLDPLKAALCGRPSSPHPPAAAPPHPPRERPAGAAPRPRSAYRRPGCRRWGPGPLAAQFVRGPGPCRSARRLQSLRWMHALCQFPALAAQAAAMSAPPPAPRSRARPDSNQGHSNPVTCGQSTGPARAALICQPPAAAAAPLSSGGACAGAPRCASCNATPPPAPLAPSRSRPRHVNFRARPSFPGKRRRPAPAAPCPHRQYAAAARGGRARRWRRAPRSQLAPRAAGAGRRRVGGDGPRRPFHPPTLPLLSLLWCAGPTGRGPGAETGNPPACKIPHCCDDPPHRGRHL